MAQKIIMENYELIIWTEKHLRGEFDTIKQFHQVDDDELIIKRAERFCGMGLVRPSFVEELRRDLE